MAIVGCSRKVTKDKVKGNLVNLKSNFKFARFSCRFKIKVVLFPMMRRSQEAFCPPPLTRRFSMEAIHVYSIKKTLSPPQKAPFLHGKWE